MSSLHNTNVVLGVTGGIAAYKSAELVRRLQDLGADVRVVMTEAAQAFITPLTLQALSGNPVHTDLLDTEAEAAMGHIELARWADCMVIAPATADFIAKLCQGQASDLLSAVWLACQSTKIIAPAMNQAMWSDTATQENMETLRKRNIVIAGPDQGLQACGDVGPGRMLEPTAIAEACAALFETGLLAGKRVIITAGPTREAIDPVRYLSNHSSGKMGYALARACVEAGAQVDLISGPVNLDAPEHVKRHAVESAEQMHALSLELAVGADVFIGAAAVADYRPAIVEGEKIKKLGEEGITLKLIANPDIIAGVAGLAERPFVVGFAAETQNLDQHAKEKRTRKGLDLIVANDVSKAGIGFNAEDNEVTVYGEQLQAHFPLQSKIALARQLVAIIAKSLGSNGT